MAGKKGAQLSAKAVEGRARKAEAAQQKKAAEDAREAAIEAEKWKAGTKNTAKQEADAQKKAELARKKAERDALLAEEESRNGGRAGPKKTKQAGKKNIGGGLDLSSFEGSRPSSRGGDRASLPALSASGIDDAIDALELTNTSGGGPGDRIERHPERRFKAALAAFEERRLREMDADGEGKGLRLNQKKERIRKEFDRSPENPFNQVTARFDASKDEVRAIREGERRKVEERLAAK